MRWRTLVAVPLAALLGAGVARPGVAHDEPAGHRIVLHRNVVVTGSTSGYVPVRFPEPTHISGVVRSSRAAGPNPQVRIEGRGRFVGVVIVADPDTPSSPIPTVIGRFAECAREACSSSRRINFVGPGSDDLTFEEGDYRLYLVADGAPARVSLRFDTGLKGRSRVHPTQPAELDLKTPRTSLMNDGHTLWSAGEHYSAGNVGFSLTAVWAKVPELKNFSTGLCQIHWPFAPPEPAYGPQCSALDQALGSGFVMVNRSFADDEFTLLGFFGYHDQGVQPPRLDDQFGLGVWVHSPFEKLERVGATTFFLQTADSWAS